jgi:hypothetical protein
VRSRSVVRKEGLLSPVLIEKNTSSVAERECCLVRSRGAVRNDGPLSPELIEI